MGMERELAARRGDEGELDRLKAENRKLRVALACEQAHAAGAVARTRGLEDALASADPGHRLLRGTGRRFPDAAEEVGADLLYADGFDARAAHLGLPSGLRRVAVLVN